MKAKPTIIATASTDGREDEIVKRMQTIEDLLLEYGLQLHGYDPGVSAHHVDEDYARLYDINGLVWRWLEPLLVELQTYRRKLGVQSFQKAPPTPQNVLWSFRYSRKLTIHVLTPGRRSDPDTLVDIAGWGIFPAQHDRILVGGNYDQPLLPRT